MHSKETVVVKVLNPNQHKANWLQQTAEAFSQAVQLGLDAANEQRTSSRDKIHKAVYKATRNLGLPADYARMAVNATVSLVRSFYGLRRIEQRVSFPKVNGSRSQGIGLGTHAYQLVRNESRWVLRVSTGKRGKYIWLPLCVPAKYMDRLECVAGDAKLFQRDGNWYAMLPIRVRVTPTPTGGSGECEHTFIGVDLGIVRHATVAAPDKAILFNGKPARHKREHFADLRQRYQRHNRLDRVKRSKGKERRWMRNLNHKVSRQIVDLATQYPNPVICLERLDGIRDRTRGSKRFNRMMASWSFRQLTDFISYKAAKLGIPVVFVDPRKTSKTCSRCDYESRYNRHTQGIFRCNSCGYTTNADLNAARNIAARGPGACKHGPPDTARSKEEQTETVGSRPDVASGHVVNVNSHGQTTTSQVPC
ncbi:MAG: RNA-guided endonuclease InsQ/TnpB family protein [Candidatus Binatia bacterium]